MADYLSTDPEASGLVLLAVQDSYLDYDEETFEPASGIFDDTFEGTFE